MEQQEVLTVHALSVLSCLISFPTHLLSLEECRTLLFEFSVEGSSLVVDHVISVQVTESLKGCE